MHFWHISVDIPEHLLSDAAHTNKGKYQRVSVTVLSLCGEEVLRDQDPLKRILEQIQDDYNGDAILLRAASAANRQVVYGQPFYE